MEWEAKKSFKEDFWISSKFNAEIGWAMAAMADGQSPINGPQAIADALNGEQVRPASL